MKKLNKIGLFFDNDVDDAAFFCAAKMEADAGKSSAFVSLAYCYYYGKGCEENQKLAAYWACRSYAHREELPEAYEVIARFYKEGYFFPKVPSMAKCCYLKLEKMGYDMSQEISAPEFRNVNPIEPTIPEFDDKAPDFFTQECPYIQYIEALRYLCGDENVSVDAKKAEELLTKAANQGYANAQYSLGIRYVDPHGRTEVAYNPDGSLFAFPTDNKLGVSLIRKAANRHHYEAMDAMTVLCFEHVGITMDAYWNYKRFIEMIFQGYNPYYYDVIVADEDMLNILKKIVDYIGVDGLLDGDKVCAMFRELAPENRKERRRVRMAYSSNAVDVLLGETNKSIAVDEAVNRMVNYSDMSIDIAKETVLAIYEVLKS